MLLALLSLLLTASPADSLTRDAGVSAIIEPGPPYILFAGDTVTPRAMVRNYGTEPARNFDVRFRIGPAYLRTVVVQSLAPGTGVEVRFDPWVAEIGVFEASCSTRLYGDENPENDRQLITIRVLRPLTLFVEPDQSASIEIGATRHFHFRAEMRGDVGDSVRLLPPALPPGWRAEYYDSAGAARLPGTGWAELGYLAPQQRRAFTLAVSAPAILADTNLPVVHRLAVPAVAAGKPTARDSALLTLTLVPGLQVHNYPNPFATRTTFIIGLPEDAAVNLAVYDRTGSLVRRLMDREQYAGPTVIERRWDGTNREDRLVAPGTYQYLLEVTRRDRTERILKHLVVTKEQQ